MFHYCTVKLIKNNIKTSYLEFNCLNDLFTCENKIYSVHEMLQ